MWNNVDTSRRVAAVLPNGRISIIQGKGLSMVGTVAEADLSGLEPEQFDYLSKNIQKVTAVEKNGKIVLKVKGGKQMTVERLEQ